ncbi:MAG TPA: hypothetical protein VFW98_11145, partial [Gemmatimonadaceae bacterium]|nr:hypothetical protein [Gemmatimonadaceae bacterium]
MAATLLIGKDDALLEGLAQSLAAAGHRTRIVQTIRDGIAAAAESLPLVAVVDRTLALDDRELLSMPLARGGALVLFCSEQMDEPPLSSALQRSVLADLTLPLERHRLLALVQRVA